MIHYCSSEVKIEFMSQLQIQNSSRLWQNVRSEKVGKTFRKKIHASSNQISDRFMQKCFIIIYRVYCIELSRGNLRNGRGHY
jgi:hypothetical protein